MRDGGVAEEYNVRYRLACRRRIAPARRRHRPLGVPSGGGGTPDFACTASSRPCRKRAVDFARAKENARTRAEGSCATMYILTSAARSLTAAAVSIRRRERRAYKRPRILSQRCRARVNVYPRHATLLPRPSGADLAAQQTNTPAPTPIAAVTVAKNKRRLINVNRRQLDREITVYLRCGRRVDRVHKYLHNTTSRRCARRIFGWLFDGNALVPRYLAHQLVKALL